MEFFSVAVFMGAGPSGSTVVTSFQNVVTVAPGETTQAVARRVTAQAGTRFGMDMSLHTLTSFSIVPNVLVPVLDGTN